MPGQPPFDIYDLGTANNPMQPVLVLPQANHFPGVFHTSIHWFHKYEIRIRPHWPPHQLAQCIRYKNVKNGRIVNYDILIMDTQV